MNPSTNLIFLLFLEIDQILHLVTTLKNLGAKWVTEKKEEFNALHMTVCFFFVKNYQWKKKLTW